MFCNHGRSPRDIRPTSKPESPAKVQKIKRDVKFFWKVVISTLASGTKGIAYDRFSVVLFVAMYRID